MSNNLFSSLAKWLLPALLCPAAATRTAVFPVSLDGKAAIAPHRRDFHLSLGVTRFDKALTVFTSLIGVATILLVCLAGPLIARAENSSQARHGLSAPDEVRLTQAMHAMDRGDLSTAENILAAMHSRIAGNYQIDESLGLVYADKNDLPRAEPLLAAAIQERPASDVAHVNLGIAYFKLHQIHRAARELERAVQLNPANGQAQGALGQAWMLLRQPAKAAPAFDAALQTDPDDPDLLYNAALARYDNRQPALAASLLARMPGVASSASAQSLYADTEEQLGHYKQAAEHYVSAAQLDPSEENVYRLGVEFLRHWTFGPAIREFAAGLKNFPDSRRMQLGLGIAYYGNGNYDQAIPVFADLLAADPTNTLDAQLFGRTCIVLTEGLNPRCASLIQFAKLHPHNAVLATYAADSILHKPSSPESLQLAQNLLRSAVTAEPDLAEAWLDTGMLLQMESKWNDSIAPLERAIRLQPDSAQAHYRLARAYERAGRHEDAKKQVALFQRYSKQQASSLDSRMQEITTLVVKMH